MHEREGDGVEAHCVQVGLLLFFFVLVLVVWVWDYVIGGVVVVYSSRSHWFVLGAELYIGDRRTCFAFLLTASFAGDGVLGWICGCFSKLVKHGKLESYHYLPDGILMS